MGYQPNHYERDNELEELETLVKDILDDIGIQMGNDITVGDLKKVLNGIKSTIINQLGKENSREWRNWEKEASYRTAYQGSIYDIWNRYKWDDNRSGYVKDEAISRTPKSTTTSAVSVVTNRPKMTLKYKVIITEEVSTFIKKMMKTNRSMEWGVAFSWIMSKENKSITIDRIYIMPVETGGAHVKFVNESEFMIFSELSELGKFVGDLNNSRSRFSGIMHSHHTMGSWHSSIDHNTIATYINDFKVVLSIVWSYNTNKGIEADIILETKDNAYSIKEFDFLNVNDVQSDELEIQESSLVVRYNDMIDLVKLDYEKFKKLLIQFDNTKKYIKINELYKSLEDEDSETIDKSILKELLL